MEGGLMAQSPNPAATHHMPGFITAPGETDVLMVVMTIFLAVIVVGFGVLFLRLHSLPERMAHRGHKLQFEIVAVLCLLALFTHMHIFWVAALLLALIDIPDFGTPLNRIAGSAEKIAGLKPGEGAAEVPSEIPAGIEHADKTTDVRPEIAAASPPKPGTTSASKKEPVHA
jgi:hypothetical protein